jgi:ribosomal protein S6--L-glutamate ligase
VVERRYLSQAQPTGLVTALRSRGHHVTLLDPQSATFQLGDDRWLSGLDLVVARGRSWELLCLVSWAETRGIPTLNTRSAIAAVHNKAEMGVALAAARVPMPRTFLGPVRMLASSVRASGGSFPIVLKPIFGDNGQGIRVVHDEAELESTEWPEPVALAQELVAGDGYERKVYGIGDDVWVVRRPSLLLLDKASRSSLRAGEQPRSENVAVKPPERELARHCSRVFGLELYGLDCIETPEGPVVLEVNEFPNYTGVPDANERLAEYVLRRGRRWSERGGR